MKYVLIIIVALTILCAVQGCEEWTKLQGLGGGDSINTSTDTYTVPAGSSTFRIPRPSSGPIWSPCKEEIEGGRR